MQEILHLYTNLQHIQLNTKSISSKNLDFVFKYSVYKNNVSEEAFQFIV